MKRAPKGNSKEGKRKGKWRRLPSRRVDELDVVAAMDPVFEGAEQPLTLSDLWDRTFSQLETEGLVTINSLQYEPITPQQLLEYESKEPILLMASTPWTKEQFPENDLKKHSRFL